MSGLLLASLAALAIGPLLARFARTRPQLLAFIDGFVLLSIGGLVLLDVLPQAIARRDLAAGLCMLAGFILPTIAERMLHYGVRQTHTTVLVLAFAGITIHSALDGSALAQAASNASGLLGYGVVLHQLPVSLMVWWVLSDRPRHVPWLILLLMATTTVAGYFAEPTLFALLPATAGSWFEALVGGSLLHVIAHPAHEHEPDHAHSHAHGHAHDHAHDHAHASQGAWPNGLGALFGLALLIGLQAMRGSAAAGPAHTTIWRTFLQLTLDSAPAVLLAYFAAGAAQAFLPVGGLAWMSRGSPIRQGLAGMAVGLPLPICSCGVVPLYQQLIQRGASTTAALAFLVATPELGVDAVMLSIPLLGPSFAIIRVIAAAVTALAVALLVSRMLASARGAVPATPSVPDALARADMPLGARLRSAWRVGFGSMVDHTAPWILVGLLLAAFLSPVLEGSWLTQLPWGVDVLVFAAIGLPLYICASASTPLVAVFLAAGVSPGAGLALLLTGPATNVSTLGVLSRMHGRRMALTFALVMMGCAVLLGLLVNLLKPSLHLASSVPPDVIGGSNLQWSAVLVLSVVYGASIVRRGARGFLSELQLAPS